MAVSGKIGKTFILMKRTRIRYLCDQYMYMCNYRRITTKCKAV